MGKFEGITTQELEEELFNRTKKLKEIPKARSIEDISNDLPELIDSWNDCLIGAMDTKYWDDDLDHHAYEDLMKLLYGKEFFSWVNSL